MLKIGITGGIGSGKTIVTRLFKLLGIPVYNADMRAKQLQQEDPKVIEQVKSAFGAQIYTSQGELDKAKMADIVFQDDKALEKLNRIVHPAVGRDFEQWVAQQSNKSYLLKEAALIFEAGSDRQLDYVIVVTAPEALRIKRIINRDNVTEKQVRARMEHQWPEEKKRKKADFVIQNDGKTLLIPQVMHIHEQLRTKKGAACD